MFMKVKQMRHALLLLCCFGLMLPCFTCTAWGDCDPLTWKHYPYYLPDTDIILPDDDGGHSEYLGEWWYASFHLTGASGKRYGAFLALFKQPQTLRQLKVFSISDLDEQRNYTYSTLLGTLIANSSHLDLTYLEGDLSPDRWYNKREGLQLVPFEYKMRVDGIDAEDESDMELDLDLVLVKPPMKVGDDSLLDIGDGFTYYYSHPRVEVTGQLTVGGVTESVTGVAWIDHQYGNPDTSIYVHWEWFAITLDDMTEIMVCDVWVNGLFTGSHSEGMNYFDEQCNHQQLENYTITPVESSRWIDPISGFPFMTQWHVEEPSKNIDLLLTAEYQDQVMHLPETFYGDYDLTVPFWEGACTIEGSIEGMPVSGKAYAELTHFCGYPLYGAFEEDEHLPINWSPYLIVDDITIPDDLELSIDPGVEILFVGDYQCNVLGKLEALGTESDPILFTHYDPEPDATWGGLRFIDADPQSILQYCTIEYGHASGGGNDSDGGGIYCSNSSPHFSHCTIRNCGADGLGGGLYLMNSDASIERCLIVGNEDGGIYYGGHSYISTYHCTISDNGQYGIQSPASEHPDWFMLTNDSIVYDNDDQSVISTPNSFTANYCDIDDYYLGGTGNIDCDPLFENNYHLGEGSCCIDAGNPDPLNNDPDNTRGDIGAYYYPQPDFTYTVCPDGSGDFLTIQEGINAAGDGHVICLCDAIFSDTGNVNLDFQGKAITVKSQSGNPEACVIYCGASSGVLCRGFYFHSGEGPGSVVDGVTITDSYCNVFPPVPGGAIWCSNGSSPTIQNCVIAGNSCGNGGGIACTGESSPMITGCVISGNGAGNDGGGIYTDLDSSPDVMSCTVSGNWAGNRGGGIFGWCLPEHTIIWDNYADGGGGDGDEWYGDGAPPITSCCNDINALGVDGFVAPPILNCGLGPDIDADPLFCDPEAGDLSLHALSPCLNAPECGQIGALGDGCGWMSVPDDPIGGGVALYQNSPNPFNSMTTILYSLYRTGPVHLRVFDPSGRLIQVLRNGEIQGPGTFTVLWNGFDQAGHPVSSGIYFYRLEAREFVETKRMTLLR